MTVFAVPWTEWLFDLLFPSRCACCGAPGSLLCGVCRGALTPIRAPLCGRCGAPTAWPVPRCRECSGRRLAFGSARAAVVYTGPARRFLGAWKERAVRPLASVAAELVVEFVPRPVADVITYIPPDGDRSLRRGHQPAHGLASELGRLWDVDVAPLLSRRRAVARQTGLTLAERRRNMRGAFAASRSRGLDAVVLVDDVYTTGATVAAAASALRGAGAGRIEVITFARTLR